MEELVIGNKVIVYPLVLGLLILIPLLAVWYFMYLKKNRYANLRMSGLQAFEGHSLRGWLRIYIPPILRISALALLIIALSRPQDVNKKEEIKGEGIDITMVMDLSSSMLAQDFKPNRLEASKKVAADFIDKRLFDRVGLVVFAGEAHTQCPPTTDYRMLQDFLSLIRCGVLQDGTAIGMGLATAVNRMKDSESDSKVIVLLTDGMNNAGYYDPMDAANMAKTLGIRVYTIGVGTIGDALAPVRRRSNGEYVFGLVPVEIDEDLLIQTSKMTGGKYFRATDNESLQKIYSDIDQLEKTEYEVTVIERRNEAFYPFVFWALILVAVEMGLKYTLLKSVP
ncbi:MAG: Ca-activated chloride channel family protein [Maribacter sp.]|jgi:Ca-activated chloride channel family protein